jgi:hypothetical protein
MPSPVLPSASSSRQILGMMSDTSLSIAQTTSVLGYSLLPMVALSSLAILLNLT